jgi:serine/threonine-protein phosphatase PGAM5
MAYRYLYLVRHGQFDHRKAQNGDGELTKLGKRQARLTVKVFKPVNVSSIHVSSMRRTLQTAAPLIKAYPEVEAQRARRLWECVPPVAPAVRETFFPQLRPGDFAAFQERADKVFDAYFKPTRGSDKHDILVTHGNLIRYLVCRAIEVNPETWVNMSSYNCGVTRMVVYPSGYVSLVAYNEVGHLPPEMHTDNLFTLHTAPPSDSD